MTLYTARFRDDFGRTRVRNIKAKHTTHAYKQAVGIAKSNNWVLLGNVGRVYDSVISIGAILQ